jgi:acyl-coenzyme A synthetase/AMP-(fatty) acid ligase
MRAHTLLDAWVGTVLSSPGAPALTDASVGRVWTRRELDALADAWHAKNGARVAGQAVVFAEPNGAEWLRLFLGLLKSDAIAIALDPGEPPVSRRALAAATGAQFLWEAGGLEPVSPRRRPHADGRRLIKLTSGSTGAPRKLVFTDAQMLADGRQICASMGIAPGDINFALIPFGHSYGLGNLVVPLLAQGTGIICGSTALPHAIAADIDRWAPTVFPAVPAILRAMAESDVASDQLGSLRTIISAGAPLAAETARLFTSRFGKKIHGFYGSSETGGVTYDRAGDATSDGRSVGRPLKGVRLRFGAGGRFSVTSAAVFTIGNRRRSGLLGSHRTADVAEQNRRGELVLRGRVGPFVKLSGRRFSLAEVERAIRQMPSVRDAFVAVQPGQPDRLAAAVATSLAAAALRVAMREKLSPWKCPRRVVVLPAFPLTARGKTDRRRLLELLRNPPGDFQPTSVASISSLSAARQMSARK